MVILGVSWNGGENLSNHPFFIGFSIKKNINLPRIWGNYLIFFVEKPSWQVMKRQPPSSDNWQQQRSRTRAEHLVSLNALVGGPTNPVRSRIITPLGGVKWPQCNPFIRIYLRPFIGAKIIPFIRIVIRGPPLPCKAGPCCQMTPPQIRRTSC